MLDATFIGWGVFVSFYGIVYLAIDVIGLALLTITRDKRGAPLWVSVAASCLLVVLVVTRSVPAIVDLMTNPVFGGSRTTLVAAAFMQIFLQVYLFFLVPQVVGFIMLRRTGSRVPVAWLGAGGAFLCGVVAYAILGLASGAYWGV